MVEKEIQKAKDLFTRYSEQILSHEKCAELLNNYRTAIHTTWDIMKGYKVTDACSLCSEKWGGGCCFIGVEDWYDKMVFLINFLLGVNIPETRTVSNGCLFVDSNGCVLLARHSFCINYLCNKIKHSLYTFEKEKLSEVSGKEILCGIQSEQSIRKWLEQNAK
jgi:hypothetical protein